MWCKDTKKQGERKKVKGESKKEKVRKDKRQKSQDKNGQDLKPLLPLFAGSDMGQGSEYIKGIKC
jgi:hypothetical protein